MNVKNKIILVTGDANGISKALCESLFGNDILIKIEYIAVID